MPFHFGVYFVACCPLSLVGPLILTSVIVVRFPAPFSDVCSTVAITKEVVFIFGGSKSRDYHDRSLLFDNVNLQ